MKCYTVVFVAEPRTPFGASLSGLTVLLRHFRNNITFVPYSHHHQASQTLARVYNVITTRKLLTDSQDDLRISGHAEGCDVIFV